MIFLLFLFLLPFLAQCQKFKDVEAVRKVFDDLPEGSNATYEELKFLLDHKTTGEEIRGILDQINDIKRGLAKQKKVSNAAMLHWSGELAAEAADTSCIIVSIDRFTEVMRISNSVKVLEYGIKNPQTVPWFMKIALPMYHSIGCAARPCNDNNMNGALYEITCLLKTSSQYMWPEDGTPGTKCAPWAWNDDGLCNNGGSSVWSAFLALALMIVMLY